MNKKMEEIQNGFTMKTSKQTQSWVLLVRLKERVQTVHSTQEQDSQQVLLMLFNSWKRG